MRELPVIRAILNESNNRFIGVNKPRGVVTVEPAWALNLTPQVYGSLSTGPYRYWRYADDSQVEIEVPNIDSISINRSLDQDAATCSIIMSNQMMHDNNETPENTQDLGRPGYYGHSYGDSLDAAGLWGQSENSWNNVLVPNALIRTYQGYGGYTEVDGKLVPVAWETAVSNGNLVQTGAWLIDNVSMGTDGKMRLSCRDMAKLLIEQMIYSPLVPQRYYPPKWSRYVYENVPSTTIEEGTSEPEPGPASLTYEDSSVERWLGSSSSLGQTASNAFSEDETEISFGHGWRHWNNFYAKDWWQATCSGEVNEVYVSLAGAPPTGSYVVWVSVMEDGVWQGSETIPYDGDDPGSNIQIYHPDKPSLDTGINYVKATAVEPSSSVNLDLDDGTWIQLPRAYDAERIRITVSSTWKSFWGPNFYRSGVGSIQAKLTNVDWVSATPTVTTTYETIQKDGNITDWLDPVKELLMWSGFLLYEGESPSSVPGVYGTLENSGTYPVDPLTEDLFDKKPVMDAITSIKEVLGYIFFIDEDGAVRFHAPNWWSLGNTLGDGTRSNYIHEIYDNQSLTDFTTNYTDDSVRSEIIIGSDLSVEDENATQFVSFDPAAVQAEDAPDLNRGMVRPAIWINEVWTNQDEQRLMAALIALHSMFNSRQGNVTIVANPEIQINDQVRIYERTTSEAWAHYVRSISSEMDLNSGQWTMTLGTNWLGEFDTWAFDRNTLLAMYNRQQDPIETGYDNGYERWRPTQRGRGQEFQVSNVTVAPDITHGVGGTWKVGVMVAADPNDGSTPEEVIDSDSLNFLSAVAAYAQVEIEYFFSQSTVPTDYDVIVLDYDADQSNMASWGSFALIDTPIIHTRHSHWDDAEMTASPGVSLGNFADIDAQSNAAFEIFGAPGVVTFGDGGTYPNYGSDIANFPTGSISIGEDPSGTESIIVAIPAGVTYQDANVSTARHVAWGAGMRDPDLLDPNAWETFGDAILWLRGV